MPDPVHLGESQWRKARELASQERRTVDEIVNWAVDAYYDTRRGPESSAMRKSLYDALAESGSLGAIRDAPSDLSTNPDHMKGFGEGSGA